MQPCVSICHCNRQALPAKSETAHWKPSFTWQGSALLQPCRRVSVTLRMQGGDESAREARASFAPRRNGGCYQKFATGVNPWVPRGLTSPPGNPASSRCSVAKADERRGGSAIPLHVAEPPRFALRIIHPTTRIRRFPKIFGTHVCRTARSGAAPYSPMSFSRCRACSFPWSAALRSHLAASCRSAGTPLPSA